MRQIGFIGTFVLACAVFAAPQALAHADAQPPEPLRLAGRLDAVTVYRGQALVTRIVEIDLGEGIHDVIVTDLPERIVPGSLHAEASPGASVRSVRYRERPVRADIAHEEESFQRRIEALMEELARVNSRIETLAGQQAYLANLESFTAGSATGDLGRGVLDAAALRELSDYLFDRREQLAEQMIDAEFAKKKIETQIADLKREQQALGARSTHTAREASINVEAQGRTAIRLHYLVNQANWSPSYTVRGDIANERVLIEYFASIEQRSGEDWSDVEMTLSTATPSLVARAPRLTALAVALMPAGARSPGARHSRAQLMLDQRGIESSRRTIAPGSADFGRAIAEADHKLNVYADRLQLQEFVDDVAASGPSSSPTNEGHSVTYRIAGRTSLPSRPERQLIQIADIPTRGEFYMVAIPVLTTYVYEEAQVVNASDSVLLGGPVAAYANGQFVGHSDLPDLSAGQPVQIGFGINSMLHADRELLKQDERIQGGNRVVDLTYRLTVQNFGGEETRVRLMDRVPQVKPSEIKLVILDDGAHTAAGVVEHHYDEKSGILRWDVAVPPRDGEPGIAVVEYSIRLEYDRQMTITAAGN